MSLTGMFYGSMTLKFISPLKLNAQVITKFYFMFTCFYMDL